MGPQEQGRAKAKAKAKALRTHLFLMLRCCCCCCCCPALALAFRAPVQAWQAGRVKPAGRRTWTCAVFGRGRMPLPKIPGPIANPARAARRARRQGCVSLPTFFAQAKKVGPRGERTMVENRWQSRASAPEKNKSIAFSLAPSPPSASRLGREDRGVLSLATFFAQAKKRFSTAEGWSSDAPRQAHHRGQPTIIPRVSARKSVTGAATELQANSKAKAAEQAPLYAQST